MWQVYWSVGALENGRSQNYPRWYRRLADMPVPNLDTVRPGHANKAVEAGVHTSFVHSSINVAITSTQKNYMFLFVVYAVVYSYEASYPTLNTCWASASCVGGLFSISLPF